MARHLALWLTACCLVALLAPLEGLLPGVGLGFQAPQGDYARGAGLLPRLLEETPIVYFTRWQEWSAGVRARLERLRRLGPGPALLLLAACIEGLSRRAAKLRGFALSSPLILWAAAHGLIALSGLAALAVLLPLPVGSLPIGLWFLAAALAIASLCSSVPRLRG